MNQRWTLGPGVERSRTAAVLAAGDLVAIGAFVVAGQFSHGFDPAADVGRLAGALAPFLVGWALVAVGGGLFSGRAVDSAGRAVLRTVPAWAIAVVIAMGLRATAAFPGDAAVTFALVAAAVGGAMLAGWRALYAAAGRASRRGAR